MTPGFTAQQNKIRLIIIFLAVVLLVLAFQILKPHQQQSVHPTTTQAKTLNKPLDDAMFMGIRHAKAQEIQSALPEATGKMTLLTFGSKLCHDCQRMAPVLSKLMPHHADVYFKKVDILDDREKHPALFRAFKPVTVPILVFIDTHGEIRNVLYNYQKSETVASALAELENDASQNTAEKPATR